MFTKVVLNETLKYTFFSLTTASLELKWNSDYWPSSIPPDAKTLPVQFNLLTKE